MVKLIEKHCGQLRQTAEIEKLLTDAIDPCEQRNFLAHGAWWAFNRRSSTVVVRGATRWEGEKAPPEQQEYTAAAIEAITEKLKDIEAGLYKLRHEIAPPPTGDKLRDETLREVGFPMEWVAGLCSWASANKSVRELWLFGSRAEGTARPDSDVDLGLGLMRPDGSHNWAFGNFTALGDQWQAELETVVGRHVSLEAITPNDLGTAKVKRWIRLWARE